jgi:hypothetical protein
MATFTDAQQKEHREQFINKCRQKAWGALCHADWIAKGIERVTAECTKLGDEQRKVEDEIKATDYKTPESRERLKVLQARRAVIPEQLKALRVNIEQGH